MLRKVLNLGIGMTHYEVVEELFLLQSLLYYVCSIEKNISSEFLENLEIFVVTTAHQRKALYKYVLILLSV